MNLTLCIYRLSATDDLNPILPIINRLKKIWSNPVLPVISLTDKRTREIVGNKNLTNIGFSSFMQRVPEEKYETTSP
jgi:hypothetical protein